MPLQGSFAKGLNDPFQLLVPNSCPNVSDSMLRSRDVWSSPLEYDATGQQLAKMFTQNFKRLVMRVLWRDFLITCFNSFQVRPKLSREHLAFLFAIQEHGGPRIQGLKSRGKSNDLPSQL